MAEWFKAAVLKTVERKLRGFESYSLRQFLNFVASLSNRSAAAAIGHDPADGWFSRSTKFGKYRIRRDGRVG